MEGYIEVVAIDAMRCDARIRCTLAIEQRAKLARSLVAERQAHQARSLAAERSPLIHYPLHDDSPSSTVSMYSLTSSASHVFGGPRRERWVAGACEHRCVYRSEE